MIREQVRARIREIGIIPSIRVSSAEAALMAADAVTASGIPILEVPLTVPGAVEVIAALVRSDADLLVGAGSVWDMESAKRCVDAGAGFLTSTGLDIEVLEYGLGVGVTMLPGALTPSEIMRAWKSGADFVKIFPCEQMGGPGYVAALRLPFPQVPMIASGGVTLQNVGEFIRAGAVAVGVGGHLVPQKAIQMRQPQRIHELARRFVEAVQLARHPPEFK